MVISACELPRAEEAGEDREEGRKLDRPLPSPGRAGGASRRAPRLDAQSGPSRR